MSGSVGCCSSSRFKEQPLSGFGICILYSVSCFAVPCAVSFVCASTFPLSLHPLSRCSLNCFCHVCLNISLFLSILCLLACCSLNCFCHMCLNISLFLSILCLLSCCSLRCIFRVCLNISSFSPSSVSWLAVPWTVSVTCASTFPSSSPSSVSISSSDLLLSTLCPSRNKAQFT